MCPAQKSLLLGAVQPPKGTIYLLRANCLLYAGKSRRGKPKIGCLGRIKVSNIPFITTSQILMCVQKRNSFSLFIDMGLKPRDREGPCLALGYTGTDLRAKRELVLRELVFYAKIQLQSPISDQLLV